MFWNVRSQDQKLYYNKMLKASAALSKLSSDSTVPFLGYRNVENIFCRAFDAENLSRCDCSVDAKKGSIGVGIKTFINNGGRTLQKVAEFNKDAERYNGKTPKEIVEMISRLRNERIQVTKRIYGVDTLLYHCVVREVGKIIVFETTMDEIELNSIRSIDASTRNIITFRDSLNEYSFNLSKSTLYKRFLTQNILSTIDVDILDDPYAAIIDLSYNALSTGLQFAPVKEEISFVILPLFSDRGRRHVPSHSGLNQWNANGRARSANEIYIPIPSWIHRVFPGFFPDRDTVFELILPDGSSLNAKVCQSGSKALMSNPNSALGEWLLRRVMNLDEGALLTYEKLEVLGLDSVVVYKNSDNTFSIDFTKIGSYDEFLGNSADIESRGRAYE